MLLQGGRAEMNMNEELGFWVGLKCGGPIKEYDCHFLAGVDRKVHSY